MSGNNKYTAEEDKLYAAIKSKDVQGALDILPQAVDSKNTTAKHLTLMLSCEHGLAEVTEAVSKNYTWQNEGYNQALPVAVKGGHRACVRVLHEYGADLNLIFQNSEPLLISAMRADDLEMFENLLGMGANPNIITTYEKNSPLHIAAKLDKNNFAKLLIQRGADVNLKNADGDTAIHVAISNSTDKQANDEIVATLVEYGAAFNYLNNNQLTAVQITINKDNEKCLEVFLNNGLLQQKWVWNDGTEDTLLHRTIRDRRMRCFLALVPRLSTADVNEINANGDTSLHVLAHHKDYVQSAWSLMRYDPNLSILNNQKKTAYELALAKKHWKVADVLKVELPPKEDKSNLQVVPFIEINERNRTGKNEKTTNLKKATKFSREMTDINVAESTDKIRLKAIPTKPKRITREMTELTMPKSKRAACKVKVSGDGGICDLSDINVEMFVPPSAVKQPHGCSVQIKKWASETDDKLRQDIKPASDVYELLPHGQEFDEDIILKFPLTLEHIYDATALDVMYSDTTSKEKSNWEPLDYKPENENKESTCMFWDGDCYVKRSHFCEIFVKEIRSVTAVIPLTALLFAQVEYEHMYLKLTVTCVGTDKQEKESVEKKFGQTAVDNQPVLLYQQGKHLQFNLKYNEKDWTADSTQEQLDKSLFYAHDYGEKNENRYPLSKPHVTFYLDFKSSKCRRSEISVKISQKLSQKLCRETQKSYFALKWNFVNMYSGMQNNGPEPPYAPSRVTAPTISVFPDFSQVCVPPVTKQNTHPSTITHKLSIAGAGLSNSSTPQSSNDKPLILDRDFRQFIKPVIQELNKDVQKLRQIAESICMVIYGDENVKIGAQFILDAWNLRQRKVNQTGRFDIWIQFLDVLVINECTEATVLLKLALEKQAMKDCISKMASRLQYIDQICKYLFDKEFIFEDQYKDCMSYPTVTEKAEFMINKILLKADKETFDGFKEQLVASKQKQILSLFVIKV